MWAGDVGSGEEEGHGVPTGDGDERRSELDEAGGTPSEPAERRTPNLFDILRARVRALSDGQLVLSASLGVAGLVVLVVVRRWPWAALAGCGALLGSALWGILDRTRPTPSLLGHGVPVAIVSIARLMAAVVALVSLLVLMLGAFGLCLGTWIS